MSHSEGTSVLIVSAGAHAFAFPVQQVAEAMRPLPIEPIAGLPDVVLGVSMIRGVPVPVVDLGALLEGPGGCGPYGRFVTLKLGARRLALAVDAVLGVEDVDAARLAALPPLLAGARAEVIDAIGTRDEQLLLLLRGARVISEDVWRVVEAQAAAT